MCFLLGDAFGIFGVAQVNIHFTQSQLKDLSGALNKIADSEGGSVGAEARDLSLRFNAS